MCFATIIQVTPAFLVEFIACLQSRPRNGQSCRKCGILLKILLVKSNVTSPYQIKQNIVSRPFLLKDTNLSSRVPRKFSCFKKDFQWRLFNTRTAHISTATRPYSSWGRILLSEANLERNHLTSLRFETNFQWHQAGEI